MITKRDVQLGKIALKAGMISKEQLAKSIAIQKKLEKKVGLGAIWLKKSFVTKDQLEEIVKLHNAEKGGGENGTSAKTKKKKKSDRKKDDASPASEDSESASAAGGESEAPASGSEVESVAGSGEVTASDEKSEKADDESAEPKKTSRTSTALSKKDDESEEPRKSSKTSTALKKDETSEPESKESKKSSRSTGALAKDKDEKKDEEPSKLKSKKIEKPKKFEPGSESEADVALFESVQSDEADIDEEDASRRVIACGECEKKYRVKKKQAGKRFACRKCGARVKVPKDLFDRPAKPEKKSGKLEPKEFDAAAESSDDASDPPMPPPEAKKPSGRDSAKTEAKPDAKTSGSIKKPEAKPAAAAAPKDPMSIAELAKAAAARKDQPLGPKISGKKLAAAYMQAALALAFAAAIGGGIWYWQYSLAQERIAQHQAEIQAEITRFLTPYDGAIKDAHATLEKAKGAEPSVDLLRDLTMAVAALDVGRKPILALKPLREGQAPIPATIFLKENVDFAIKHDETEKGEDLQLQLSLTKVLVQLALGGQKFVGDAVGDLKELLKQDPKNAAALELLGRAELARHDYFHAVEALKKSLAVAPDPKTRAWLALACVAGDVPKDAIAALEPILESQPLAKVLKARALFADGDYDNAIVEANDAASKLGNEGESVAAAHALCGLACERKNDVDGSDKAFDACVTAGGESGRGLVARGEHRLRVGKFEDAAKDFEAAIKVSGGARAAAGLGDAKAGQLDEDAARSARLQAVGFPVRKSGALLVGEIDVFDDPRGPDPRAVAYRRLGDASFAAGRLDDAHTSYYKAIEADGFDPESFAALARLESAQNDLGQAELHVKQARNFLTSAAEKPSSGEPAPLVRGAATARVLLAEALFWVEKGELQAAEKTIDASVAADPLVAGAYAYALKGKILEKRLDNVRARTEYLRALDLEESGKDLTARFYAQAKKQFEAAAKSGDPATIQKARAALGAVLTLAPKHAHALYLRGRLAVLAKKWDEALNDLSAAIDLNRYFREAYIARGYLFVRDLPDDRRDDQAGEKARIDFRFAASIDETKADAWYGSALTFWMSNDTTHTLEDVEKAIALAPKRAPPYHLRSQVNKQNNKDAAADADEKKFQELNKLGEQNP